MGICKHYFATCDECGRAYGSKENEPSSLCNIEMVYHAESFEDIVEKIIIGKWLETADGWLCNECQNKAGES